jgi:hypothetical protein
MAGTTKLGSSWVEQMGPLSSDAVSVGAMKMPDGSNKSRPVGLIESEDRWLLPYRGCTVTQVRVSYQLTLILDNGAEVQLETEVMLSDGPLGSPGASAARLVPEGQDAAPALSLFGAKVLSSVVFKTGGLRLVFDTGSHLSVEPHPQYEAWNVRGQGRLVLVCQPGGGVALWR